MAHEYLLKIKKHASRIYNSDIKEDAMEAFYDALENDVDGIAKIFEEFRPNLAQLIRTMLNEHKDRRILDELCDDLANYADYSASDVKIKDIGYDYDWLELTLPIEINPDLFEAYLEGIKAHYEE